MKKFFAVLVCVLSIQLLHAQYYYLDVLGTQQANERYQAIKNNQLKKISAVSYEGNLPATDFVLEQTIQDNQVVTRSSSVGRSPSVFTSVYNNSRLAKTTDSSNISIVKVDYEYNNEGQVSKVTSVSKDAEGRFSTMEVHNWAYNAAGKPEKMLKIKNGLDTTTVSFKYDEAGNVTEETWKKNKRTIDTYYYYYNDKNQLTDVVRFHNLARRLLPEYIFEYDANGKIVQMTQAQQGSTNYLTYKYMYNDKGLKEKEFIFDKHKQLLGRIEYKYQ